MKTRPAKRYQVEPHQLGELFTLAASLADVSRQLLDVAARVNVVASRMVRMRDRICGEETVKPKEGSR